MHRLSLEKSKSFIPYSIIYVIKCTTNEQDLQCFIEIIFPLDTFGLSWRLCSVRINMPSGTAPGSVFTASSCDHSIA